jgi:3-oxosteroid 1-dehydrogenase
MGRNDTKITRRNVVVSGLALGSAMSITAAENKPKASASATAWDMEVDIVCVGSGCAAITAAVTAVGNGDTAVVLEREKRLGGTTAKSGAVHWIPNNPTLKAAGVVDERSDALQYMVRYSYPNSYVATHPTLGITEDQFKLIAALYDNGFLMVERLISMGVYNVAQWKLSELGQFTNPGVPVMSIRTPDYMSHAPENKVKSGRAIAMTLGEGKTSGTIGGGVDFIERFASFFKSKGGTVLTEHPVIDVVANSKGEVVGVLAQNGEKQLRVRARKGVIFGTGGFAQNPSMLRRFLKTMPFGSCAGIGSQGDLIRIATRLGAALGNMPNAWWANVPVEQALKSRVFGTVMFAPSGDSMIHVNKHGKRYVDEYRPYNSHGKVYQSYEPLDEEYPNHIVFAVFDQRTVDIYGGDGPLPRPGELPYWVMKADTLDQLTQAISSRLETLRSQSIGTHLAKDFSENLKKTIHRFNGFARAGVDEDFGRGKYELDREFFGTMSLPRDAEAMKGQKFSTNTNRTMYPISDTGPYYAIMLGLGLLDTTGGPVVNDSGQMVDYDGKPIPGLYGAGNCIAAPSGEAYYGAGGTVGPGMTFGYISANHAHGAPVKEVA